MHRIFIHGRLTRDPELKEIDTKNGSSKVCNFTVASDRQYGEEADFFDCAMFGKRAEVIEKFFQKGSEIVVSGEMQKQKYKNKDGENRYNWKCIVNNFDFCGSKKERSGDPDVPEGFEAVNDEEIPF